MHDANTFDKQTNNVITYDLIDQEMVREHFQNI